MIKTIITKITTNNYQNSNNKNKKKSPPYIQKSLSSKRTTPITPSRTSRNSEAWWIRTRTTMLLGVLFRTCRRCHRDVPMRRCGYVQLRRLDNVALRHRWMFYLRRASDVVKTC